MKITGGKMPRGITQKLKEGELCFYSRTLLLTVPTYNNTLKYKRSYALNKVNQ